VQQHVAKPGEVRVEISLAAGLAPESMGYTERFGKRLVCVGPLGNGVLLELDEDPFPANDRYWLCVPEIQFSPSQPGLM